MAVYRMHLAEYSSVRLHGAIEFPHYNINIDFLSSLKRVEGVDPSLNTPSRYYQVIVSHAPCVRSKFATPGSTSTQIASTNQG
jgi:hypothetical protein